MDETPKLQSESVVVRRHEPVTTEIDGQMMMTGSEQGQYFQLDPVGARIWELLDQPVSVSELCDALQEEFQVEPEACERDVLSFLQKLLNSDLLELVDAPSS